jgi:NAD(P)-dependent dehydrogenase (short-subunit alcohol dehydrogenase family)
MLLKNKVCVIAGAGSLRGIGYATAELYAEHGARIVVTDIAMDAGVTSALRAAIEARTGLAPEILGVRCDISEPSACEEVMAQATARYGKIDSLTNCAGIVASRGFLDITPNEFGRMLQVNLLGAFNLCQSVLPWFEKQGSGAIVNVSSVAAQRGGGLVGGGHYAASKGGLTSLTKTIAREFGPRGIRANVVCPSMTDTGMLDGNMPADRYDAVVANIPLRRAGRPSEIAGACLFLTSELSAYVTGATIDVNGGSHIH